MITKERLNHGEGDIVEENTKIGSILKVRTFLMRRKSFERLSLPCWRW
jgi:hypothetical protein